MLLLNRVLGSVSGRLLAFVNDRRRVMRKNRMVLSICMVLSFVSVVFAGEMTYNGMAEVSGGGGSFWDVTGYKGVVVFSGDSSSATLDTLTWTQAESHPAIKLNTKPYVSLKLILR